jgi:hypothetical protein
MQRSMLPESMDLETGVRAHQVSKVSGLAMAAV